MSLQPIGVVSGAPNAGCPLGPQIVTMAASCVQPHRQGTAGSEVEVRNNRAVVGEFPRLRSVHDLKMIKPARKLWARKDVVGGEEPWLVGRMVAMTERLDVPAGRLTTRATGKWSPFGLRLLQQVDKTERVDQREDGRPAALHHVVVGLVVDVQVTPDDDPAVERRRVEKWDQIRDRAQDRGLGVKRGHPAVQTDGHERLDTREIKYSSRSKGALNARADLELRLGRVPGRYVGQRLQPSAINDYLGPVWEIVSLVE